MSTDTCRHTIHRQLCQALSNLSSHRTSPPPHPPELPAERSARVPGGRAALSSLGDMGGETMGVVSCGSVYIEVLVSGSHVICGWAGWVGGWGRRGRVGHMAVRGAGRVPSKQSANQQTQQQYLHQGPTDQGRDQNSCAAPPACAYSSCLASWMSEEAPLPNASSMPASFFTRLRSGGGREARVRAFGAWTRQGGAQRELSGGGILQPHKENALVTV